MNKRTRYISILLLLIVVSVSLFFSVLWITKKQKKHAVRISGAYRALNLWHDQRAYPNMAIPDVGHYAAFEYSKKNIAASSTVLNSSDQWETMGPHNIAGRILAVVFNPQNPNTIYIGSASGGLWRSGTAGIGYVAWEYVPTGFPVLGVSTIAIAPDDSNTIYIGTGEVYQYQNVGTGYTLRPTRGSYGIGILKTTDSGETWSKSLDWSYNQQRAVQIIKINPLNPNTVWAGTTEGTYKSIDAGDTWVLSDSTIMVSDLVVDPVDTQTVYIGCGDLFSEGHGIYRTSDNGTSWIQLTQGLPGTFGGKVLLDIYPPSPHYVFASIGNGTTSEDGASWLCRSTDRGDTWMVMSDTDYTRYQGWFSHDVAVCPVDSNIVIAVGVDSWKSTNGGANLVQKSYGGSPLGRPPQGGQEGDPDYVHSDKHDVIFHPDDPSLIYYATDGGIFRSTDQGETFESHNGGLQTVQFYQGFATSMQDSQWSIGGLQDNGTIIHDGLLQWIRVIGGDGSFAGISSSNDDIMYGSWQYLNIMKSSDHGETWNYGYSPPEFGETPFIAPFALGLENPDVIYAGRSHVFRSSNGGANWITTNNGNELDGNMILALQVSHSSDDLVYATTAPTSTVAGIYRSWAGGATWDNVTGTLPDRYMVDVAIDPIDPMVVYVVLSGFGTSHVFKSSNAGDAWEDIGEGLPDVPTSAIVIDPMYTDHIYVGNDIGVYVSVDGGDSWQSFQEGLPEAVIAMDLVISPSSRKLQLATHGNGAYQRNLLDETSGTGSDKKRIPLVFQLDQNYPNPFNPSTTIRYQLESSSPVELSIYNLQGQKVRTLVDTEQSSGPYQVEWDGRNESGIQVSSGVYFYRFRAGSSVETRKMLLVK